MMQPHEERVVEEKRDLDEKLGKLNQFMATSPTFEGLSDENKLLMRQQATAMAQYSGALGGRISRFGPDLEPTRMPDGEIRHMAQQPQSPTLGRIVLFTPKDSAVGFNGAKEYVAIIGQVWADPGVERPYVNLLTFPPFSAPQWEGSVQEYDPGQTEPSATPARSWRWPPRA